MIDRAAGEVGGDPSDCLFGVVGLVGDCDMTFVGRGGIIDVGKIELLCARA